MFRTAATKLAHNSTIPALAGNKDLKPLQDLITAEKAVLNSLQRLSVDIAKASEALKAWGLGEGEDLGDTLSASTALYLHYAAALSAFANHEITVREQMKSVRSREEGLDELRRRRRQLASKSDAADKKLNRMKSDNKNYQEQVSTFERMRDDIRIMDTDIMAEEASLGDYKRSSARSWMGIKFGGLLECAQRGVIVGDLGKLVIAEIPTEETEPGLSRPLYAGHARTQYLVAAGQRAVNEIFFSPDSNPNSIRPPTEFELPPGTQDPNKPSTYGEYQPADAVATSRPRSMSMSILGSDRPPSTSSRFSQNQRSPMNGGYDTPASPTMPMPNVIESGEFGILADQYAPRVASARSPDVRERVSGPRGARYSTFPQNQIGGPRPLSAAGMPTGGAHAPPAQYGDRMPSLDIAQPQEDFSSSVAQALGGQWTAGDPGASQASASVLGASPDIKGAKRSSVSSLNTYEPPPPMYEPLAGLPPGAAPAQPPQGGSWSGHMLDEGLSAPSGSERAGDPDDDEDHVQLAYNANDSDVSLGAGEGGERRVTFADSGNAPETVKARVPDSRPDNDWQSQNELSQPQHQQEISTGSIPPRLPTPGGDDRSLDAAAAREVSRELDALMFNTPSPSVPVAVDRTPSPLAPPRALFSQRSVSPHPNMAISTSPTSPVLGPQYTRERDRSVVSPTPPAFSGDHTSTTLGGDPGGDMLAPGSNLRSTPSPSPSAVSNGTQYRTPLETMASPVITTSMYSLSPTARGSGTSVSTPTGGARTISAAAFRRQAQIRNASSPTLDSPADVGPLQVHKRQMPSSPLQPLGAQGAPDQRHRSVSAQPQNGDNTRGRMSGERPSGEHGDEGEEYDYISAYVDSSRRSEDEQSGYGQGRYSTSLGNEQDRDGLR